MSEHIDRAALLARHRVDVHEIEPGSALSVGNGEFCFTVDATGLQTFPASYPVFDASGSACGTLLGTQSQWGWHSTPRPGDARLEDFRRAYETTRGPTEYVDLDDGLTTDDSAEQGTAAAWLRGNPHRLDLGWLGLWTPAGADPGALAAVEQSLDLATGIISSRFQLGADRFVVTTAAHASRDAIGVRIRRVGTGRFGLRLSFAYGSTEWGNAADWSQPDRHSTDLELDGSRLTFTRRLDGTQYQTVVAADEAHVEPRGAHEFVFVAESDVLNVTIEFSPAPCPSEPLTVDGVVESSRRGWSDFWCHGGVVQLSRSDAADAAELERRVVLSQYLTRIQCAGSLPPAETGLTLNSWRGKFHLEMHWWHAAHFAQWGRPELLERSLRWYETALLPARETASRQGFRGARWPKQVGPDAEETPSSIGPFLIWQQPHPIHLAELVYRASPGREVLEHWAAIVFATADFMADFALPDDDGEFSLGPPVIPAQESYAAERARLHNPTFELAYWAWALEVAAQWRDRLRLAPAERWRVVATRMAAPRRIRSGYAALASPPGLVRTDHPSMLAALGVVPPTPVIDCSTMERTLESVIADWDWASTWGWDYPMMAMTATRVGRPDLATRSLLLDAPKNRYLHNGHNYQTPQLPLYLPGNGGLLAAVGLMAAGAESLPGARPGFGAGWNVDVEGVLPMP